MKWSPAASCTVATIGCIIRSICPSLFGCVCALEGLRQSLCDSVDPDRSSDVLGNKWERAMEEEDDVYVVYGTPMPPRDVPQISWLDDVSRRRAISHTLASWH